MLDIMKLVDGWLSQKGFQDLKASNFRGCCCCFVSRPASDGKEEKGSCLPATHQAMHDAAEAEAGLTSVLLSRLALEVSARYVYTCELSQIRAESSVSEAL